MNALNSAAMVLAGILIGAVLTVLGTQSGVPGLGGVYSTVSPNVPGLNVTSIVGSNATTSISTGKVCFTVTTASGGTIYWFANAAGNLATSTASCL